MSLVLYLLQLCAIAALIALAVSVYVDGVGYNIFHVPALSGVAAYTFAILTTQQHWNVVLAALCAVLVAAAMGLVVAEVISTVRGDGLTLATFGIAVASVELFRRPAITGGVFGIGGIPSFEDSGHPWQMAIVMLFVGVALILVQTWRRSLGGVVVTSVRMSEWAAVSIGAPLRTHLRATGVLSGTLAGMGGICLASSSRFIEPRDFQPSSLLIPFCAVILARGHTPAGVILSAFALVGASQAVRFVGTNPVVSGPLTEIALALAVSLIIVASRLRARHAGHATV